MEDEDKPIVSWVDEEMLREQRAWNRWEETGVAEAEDPNGDARSCEEMQESNRAAPAA